MEISSQFLFCVTLPKPRGFSTSLFPPFFFHSKASAPHSVPFLGFRNNLLVNPQCIRIEKGRKRNLTVINASGSEITAPDESGNWLLEPVGDGDSRHLGYKVSMPDAFEIASNTVTVGRVPEKADVAIPVATVSGVHARIQKKDGNLLVTDLDSTNGTFIDDRRLRPGVAAVAPPGSCVIFGDIHLAMFRVSKLEKAEAPVKSEESEPNTEGENKSENSEATS
ncbi:Zeaxanthin epoxidase [Bertholletia excelsa]